MRNFDDDVWFGALDFPNALLYIPKGKFYTNIGEEEFAQNYILFSRTNYILIKNYTKDEIRYSNYMKKYGIDYERK